MQRIAETLEVPLVVVARTVGSRTRRHPSGANICDAQTDHGDEALDALRKAPSADPGDEARRRLDEMLDGIHSRVEVAK
jgi:hypothetical protein